MPNSAVNGEYPVQQDYFYTLLIAERLASNWSEDYEGLAVTYTPGGETQLAGIIPDQSALHGLLARIRDLNLTLISVNRVLTDETFENEHGKTSSEPIMEERE